MYLAMRDEHETITLYELVDRTDGTVGIGNSFDVGREEAIKLILGKVAKHEAAPIGELPSCLLDGEAVEVEDNGNDLKAKRSSSA